MLDVAFKKEGVSSSHGRKEKRGGIKKAKSLLPREGAAERNAGVRSRNAAKQEKRSSNLLRALREIQQKVVVSVQGDVVDSGGMDKLKSPRMSQIVWQTAPPPVGQATHSVPIESVTGDKSLLDTVMGDFEKNVSEQTVRIMSSYDGSPVLLSLGSVLTNPAHVNGMGVLLKQLCLRNINLNDGIISMMGGGKINGSRFVGDIFKERNGGLIRVGMEGTMPRKDADVIIMCGRGEGAAKEGMMSLQTLKQISLTRISMCTFIGVVNFKLEPWIDYKMGVDGLHILSLYNCSNGIIAGCMFEGEGFAIRLENCTDMLIQGCSFRGCGISIKGGCKNIRIEDCLMVTFTNSQGTGDALISIEGRDMSPCMPDSPPPTVQSVYVVRCVCKTLVHEDGLTKENMSGGMVDLSTPCFIMASGGCELLLSECMIMGSIGILNTGTDFRFEDCMFEGDARLYECLGSDVNPHQVYPLYIHPRMGEWVHVHTHTHMFTHPYDAH